LCGLTGQRTNRGTINYFSGVGSDLHSPQSQSP
jgi:hypothetical protein